MSRQDTSKATVAWAKLSRPRWRPVVQHLTVARVAEGLGVAWNTAKDAVLAEGKRILIDDTTRFDGVAVVGVDEHVVRHEALLFRMEVRDRAPRGAVTPCAGVRPAPPFRRSGAVEVGGSRIR